MENTEKDASPNHTTFTDDLGDLICGLIAEGQSVRKICKLPDMPVISTVMLWVAKGNRGVEPYVAFSEQYACAMNDRTEYWAEEIIDIADDDSEDEIFTEEGKRFQNGEFIARSRLKIDSRKWLMGKLKPKKYGDKTTTEMVGDPDRPVVTQTIEVTYVKPQE